MKQNPSWEANSHSSSQKIHHPLWRENVHYRVKKNPHMVPIPSHINPVHMLLTYFFKILSDIIFPCISRISEWLFPSGSPTRILHILLTSPMHATWTAYFNLLDFITLVTSCETYEFMILLTTHCSLKHSGLFTSDMEVTDNINTPRSNIFLCDTGGFWTRLKLTGGRTAR
jgi:hypothetical protein